MESLAPNPQQNPLATQSIGRLLLKYAIPSIVAMLVSALYNIVDQIFIGQGVGVLGNAATNVAFPIVTACTSLALLLGIGGASNFNLKMGAGEREQAGLIAGNAIFLLASAGIGLMVIVFAFLQPLLYAFGATAQVYDYAYTYTSITAIGIPFLIFATGASHLIRADGSPKYAMMCTLVGAILNTILDPLFIFTFHMGVAGAAIATVIGQGVSCVLAIIYLTRYRSVHFTRAHFKLSSQRIKRICGLGGASCFNQLAMMAVQIAMNNTLTYYGQNSIYGQEIPLACAGIIIKVNMIMMALVIGIAQGCQPIVGFNYGAKNYGRVKRTFRLALTCSTIISVVAFLCFQLFPRQIISIFGSGSEEYFLFAERYFRIFLFLTFLNGLQPVIANFFTSIGKATRGIFLSMTRQIIFLLPLILLLPLFMGIDGVMYAGPVADGAAAILALIFVIREMNLMTRQERELAAQQAIPAEQP